MMSAPVDSTTVAAMLTALTLWGVLHVLAGKGILETDLIALVCHDSKYFSAAEYLFYYSGVGVDPLTVQFDRREYSVVEGDTVTLSITLSKEAESQINVDLSTMDVTTQGTKLCHLFLK